MKSSGMTRRTVGAAVLALASVLLVVSAKKASAQTLPPGCFMPQPAPMVPGAPPPPPPVMVCPPTPPVPDPVVVPADPPPVVPPPVVPPAKADPQALLAALQSAVAGLQPKGLAESLSDTLDEVGRSLLKGRNGMAREELERFVDKLGAHRASKLAPATADSLVKQAQDLSALLAQDEGRRHKEERKEKEKAKERGRDHDRD